MTLTAAGTETPLTLKKGTFSPSRDGPTEIAVFVNHVERDVVEDVIPREAVGLSVQRRVR